MSKSREIVRIGKVVNRRHCDPKNSRLRRLRRLFVMSILSMGYGGVWRGKEEEAGRKRMLSRIRRQDVLGFKPSVPPAGTCSAEPGGVQG